METKKQTEDRLNGYIADEIIKHKWFTEKDRIKNQQKNKRRKKNKVAKKSRLLNRRKNKK